jgi:hypothetical protein
MPDVCHQASKRLAWLLGAPISKSKKQFDVSIGSRAANRGRASKMVGFRLVVVVENGCI